MGIALIVVSFIAYLLIKPETSNKVETNSNRNQLINTESTEQIIKKEDEEHNETTVSKRDFFDNLPTLVKRILGISLSIFSGLMYGQANTPVTYVRNNYPNYYPDASDNALDHIFSYYTGILCSSIIYFIIYCIAKRNNPILYPKTILPGLVSGIMWGLANLCLFFSVNALNQAISYPISCSGPPIVASLWGVLLYREIKGLKNLIFLMIGFAISITGSVLTGLSF